MVAGIDNGTQRLAVAHIAHQDAVAEFATPQAARRLSGHAGDAGDAVVLQSSRWSVEGAPLFTCALDDLIALLPFPEADANKYSRGTLTLIAGSERYPGAACLAALGAQRMGAGYVQAVVPASVRHILLTGNPSVVAIARKSWDAASIAPTKPNRPQAVCIGPGFDEKDKETPGLVHETLRHAACPVLVDGGALSCLVTKKGRKLLERRFANGHPTVITPHGGEAARLGKAFDFNEKNPARLATLLSLALGATVVLKGPETFVSDGERTFVVTEGTPDLAKAGTGDVLAGMIGALLAQGLGPMQAGVLGATLHARAGRLAGARYTTFGVRAEDVCDFISAAIVDLTK